MVTSNTSENVDNSTDGATVVDNSNTTNTENTSVEAGTENTVANESVEQTNTTGEEVVSEQ